MKANGSTEPRLRFRDEWGKEFPDWKLVQLRDIAKIFRGSGLSKADLDPCGQYSCILYGELFTKYRETIREVFSKQPWLVKTGTF